MSTPDQKRLVAGGAFSLIEVIVALAICAAAIALSVAFLTALQRAASQRLEHRIAAELPAALVAQLRRQPFDDVLARLKTTAELERDDRLPHHDAITAPRLVFADRSGEVFSPGDAAVWDKRNVRRFFELTLVRDDRLPGDATVSSACLVFAVRVRWPVQTIGAPMGRAGQQRMLLSVGSLCR